MVISRSESFYKRIYLYTLLLASLNYNLVKNVEAKAIKERRHSDSMAPSVSDTAASLIKTEGKEKREAESLSEIIEPQSKSVNTGEYDDKKIYPRSANQDEYNVLNKRGKKSLKGHPSQQVPPNWPSPHFPPQTPPPPPFKREIGSTNMIDESSILKAKDEEYAGKEAK